MKTFGERLKSARERADGITQVELAKLIDVHHFTVSKWEQNLFLPKKERTYEELAHCLNCSRSWLRDGTGEMGVFEVGPGMTDREKRRTVTRRPRLRMDSPAGQAYGRAIVDGAVDWSLVVLCFRLLIAVDPAVSDDRLGRALSLFYSMAQRSPDSCDETMAMQILQAVG